jgi:hypothetical protein
LRACGVLAGETPQEYNQLFVNLDCRGNHNPNDQSLGNGMQPNATQFHRTPIAAAPHPKPCNVMQLKNGKIRHSRFRKSGIAQNPGDSTWKYFLNSYVADGKSHFFQPPHRYITIQNSLFV